MSPFELDLLPTNLWQSRLSPHLAQIEQASLMTIGVSAAQVFQLRDRQGAITFLKVNPHTSNLNLAADAARLRWLGHHLPVPKVLSFHEDDTHSYLLMSAIAGKDCATLAVEKGMETAKIVRLLAEGLRRFHAVPIADCPFDHRLLTQIERTQGHIERDLQGEAQKQAFAEFEALLARAPRNEDLVLTHGDACLPNIMLRDDDVSGYIDLGLAGVADRYRDLALASRSLIWNCGAEWVPQFFENYGITGPDEAKISFYRQLEDFW